MVSFAAQVLDGVPIGRPGVQDGLFVSIETPEVLILAFTDNRVYNGPGDDLWIYAADDRGATVEVRARASDGPCTLLGVITDSGGFDLADAGLDYVDFIRFVGLENSAECPGYDLDAVLALNSIDRNSACPIPAPAAMLLTSLGTLLVTTLRRRRML